MNSAQFKTEIVILRDRYQTLLNDTYIWSALLSTILQTINDNDKFIQLFVTPFKVPSRIENKTVKRTQSDIKALFESAHTKGLPNSVFVFVVSQVESCLNEVFSLVLRFDFRRLKTRIQGFDHANIIDINDVLDLPTKEAIIDSIIQKELVALSYAGPTKQIEYFKRVLSVEIPADIINDWIEIKASRDLVVHNSSIINKVYIDKVGVKKRGEIGDQISINGDYFEKSIATTKSLIGKICTAISKNVEK
jgi:hypothetical protein